MSDEQRCPECNMPQDMHHDPRCTQECLACTARRVRQGSIPRRHFIADTLTVAAIVSLLVMLLAGAPVGADLIVLVIIMPLWAYGLFRR